MWCLMADSQYIVKEKDPNIIFWYDAQTDIKTFSKYSKILKQLNIPARKRHNNKEWIYEQVKISVSFRENQPIHFSFDGTENFPRPYYASLHIHENNKNQFDRTRCYEVKQNDIKIINTFFEIASTIKSVMLYMIWFHEFPSEICNQSNLDGFNFHSSRIDKFPDNFKDLSNLKRINMEFSWVKMPNSFANCKKLEKLNFREACLIDKFPDDIGNCLKLQELIYAETYHYQDYLKLSSQIGDKIGITTLPASIGKIPNLTKIELSECFNLRSLPEELAFFPLKHIHLRNSGHLMKNETYLPKSLVDSVLIYWDYLGQFDFKNNKNVKKNLNFDQIIDRLTPVSECLQTNVFSKLIWNFPKKKNNIIRILEQWAEKTNNQETKKIFQDFINKISPKIKISQGNLFL